MGMIKLPQASLDFFYENSKEIFSTGELAEGKWNKKVARIDRKNIGLNFHMKFASPAHLILCLKNENQLVSCREMVRQLGLCANNILANL